MKVDCGVARWWGWAARPEFRHRASSNLYAVASTVVYSLTTKKLPIHFSRHTLAVHTPVPPRTRTRLALNRLLPYAQTPLKSPAASRPLLCRPRLGLIDLLDVRAAAAAAARGRAARHTTRLQRERERGRERERSVRHTSRKKCATIDCVPCSVWTQSLTMPPGMPPMPPPPPPCE